MFQNFIKIEKARKNKLLRAAFNLFGVNKWKQIEANVQPKSHSSGRVDQNFPLCEPTTEEEKILNSKGPSDLLTYMNNKKKYLSKIWLQY